MSDELNIQPSPEPPSGSRPWERPQMRAPEPAGGGKGTVFLGVAVLLSAIGIIAYQEYRNRPAPPPLDPRNLPIEKPPEPPSQELATMNQPASAPPVEVPDIPDPDFTPTITPPGSEPAAPDVKVDDRKLRSALADKVKGFASSENDAEKKLEKTYVECIEAKKHLNEMNANLARATAGTDIEIANRRANKACFDLEVSLKHLVENRGTLNDRLQRMLDWLKTQNIEAAPQQKVLVGVLQNALQSIKYQWDDKIFYVVNAPPPSECHRSWIDQHETIQHSAADLRTALKR